MLEPDAISLLEKHGIPYPAYGLAETADEAVRIADGLGYPVVMKVVSPDALHKSDVGGVKVDVLGPGDVRLAYSDILASLTAHSPRANVRGMLVCKQAPDGLELIVGAIQDAMFGPTIMVGLGGVLTEVLDDVSLRLVPIDSVDAGEMIRELRGYPLLQGVRGRAALDEPALIRLLMDVSRLLEAEPGICELDLNPVRIYEQGLLVLDVRLIRDNGEE